MAEEEKEAETKEEKPVEPEAPKTEEAKPEAVKEAPKAEEAKPEAAKEEPKAEEAKPEAVKEEPKAEVPKADAPAEEAGDQKNKKINKMNASELDAAIKKTEQHMHGMTSSYARALIARKDELAAS